MESSKRFAEIWSEAHRTRSEYVWSIITRMMATPRRPAPRVTEDEAGFQAPAAPAASTAAK